MLHRDCDCGYLHPTSLSKTYTGVKFLAHLADGPDFDRGWDTMERYVQQAKRQGLHNITAKVVVVDTTTIGEDKYMHWSKQAVSSQVEQNRAIIKEVSRLVSGNIEVIWHHINEEKDLTITTGKQILVTSI